MATATLKLGTFCLLPGIACCCIYAPRGSTRWRQNLSCPFPRTLSHCPPTSAIACDAGHEPDCSWKQKALEIQSFLSVSEATVGLEPTLRVLQHLIRLWSTLIRLSANRG